MDNQKAKHLLRKYRLGRCAAEEKEIIEEWYEQQKKETNEDHDEYLKEVEQSIWHAVHVIIKYRLF